MRDDVAVDPHDRIARSDVRRNGAEAHVLHIDPMRAPRGRGGCSAGQWQERERGRADQQLSSGHSGRRSAKLQRELFGVLLMCAEQGKPRLEQ